MATYVEFNLAHTTGSHVHLCDTPAEAVEAAGLLGDDECSVYLMILKDDTKRWGVKKGHDSYGVHSTADFAIKAETWFDVDWSFTTSREICDAINEGTYSCLQDRIAFFENAKKIGSIIKYEGTEYAPFKPHVFREKDDGGDFIYDVIVVTEDGNEHELSFISSEQVQKLDCKHVSPYFVCEL